jgi:4-hydroxybenzoate polyprenyltransferase
VGNATVGGLDAAVHACHGALMETIQSREAQGRVADAPSGHWVYRLLPRWLWPYAQIARWDRPIGWWLLLWPCWWSAALAATAHARPGSALPDALPSPWHLALFLAGAIAMRGAGCTWNDISDADIDGKVARTASRPIPSGQTTKKKAAGFLVIQAFAGLGVLIAMCLSGPGAFNWFAFFLAIASLAVVAVYPFMKRITNWPQIVLGLAFSWGALMGWALAFGALDLPAILLYAGSVLWVIGYDTIYAHQDREDDALVGVKSTALLFGANTKKWLIGLYGGGLLMFVYAYATAQVPFPAFAGLLAAGIHFGRQIQRLDVDNPAQCLALFKSNNRVGWLIFLGLIGGGLWAALQSPA